MILRYIITIFGIISLSEGKGCPQHSKPHLTRCDMYYKCALLPSKNHVWVPTKCDAGLIYESSLKMCVLAGDDWECTLGENGNTPSGDENNVYGINNLDYLDEGVDNLDDQPSNSLNKENELSAPDAPDAPQSDSNKNTVDNNEKIIVVNSDSDDGNEIEISDGVDPAVLLNNKDNTNKEISVGDSSEEFETSGDGAISESAENKENYFAIPIDSVTKGSVSSHLQRLTQLIQSLSESQYNNSQSYDLGPNELNNFLANHNIQSDYKTHIFIDSNKHAIPENGKIHPDHLTEILQLQQKLQDLTDIVMTTTVPVSEGTLPTTTTRPTSTTPISTPNPVNIEKYPELTKIHIKNHTPFKYGNPDPGYSSSQIVVNRPEGSVLFSVPSNTPVSYKKHEIRNEPYISEETLKTMLELSKQMISSQHGNPSGYVPEQNYLQPIFRPIYYNIPIHELPIPILSGYGSDFNQQDQAKRKIKPIVKKEQTTEPPVDYQKLSDLPKNDKENETNKDHPTIIHNHIPITIENRRNKPNKPKPSSAQNDPLQISADISYERGPPKPDSTYKTYIPVPTNSFKKYDIKPVSNYPNFDLKSVGNFGQNQNYNSYDQNSGIYVPNGSGDYYYSPLNVHDTQSTTPYPSYSQHQQQIPGNPYNSFTNNNYNNYPNNPPQFYQNPQYIINNTPVGQSMPNYYTPAPHLNGQNINDFLKLNTPSYPTIKPSQSYITTNPAGTYQTQMNSPGISTVDGTNKKIKNHKEDDLELDDTEYESVESMVDSEEENNFNNSGEQQDTQVAPSLKTTLFSDDLATNFFGDNKKKIVNFAGNFMSYDAFEKSVAPLLQNSADITNDIEVITCVTGARQPNKTDCTRYFVCNSKTNHVIPYVCPPYTGFNSQTRFCDAKTYASCNPTHIQAQITIDANRQIQIKAQQALDEANRVRDEALKTQRLATLIKLQTQNMLNEQVPIKKQQIVVTQKPLVVYRVTRKPVVVSSVATPVNVITKGKPIIRKVSCREPGKVADSLSKYNYFLCYKGSDNKLRARKMTCPGALVFCKALALCTQVSRCPLN